MGLECRAQQGYIVSGKIQGMTVQHVFLVSSATGTLDTLGRVSVNSGSFFIQGSVTGVREALLVFEGVDVTVPFLLENAVFQVLVTPQGIALQGGGSEQELLRQYNHVAQEFVVAQQKIQAEVENIKGNEAKLKELQNKVDVMYAELVEKNMMLIKEHKDRYATAYVIAAGMRNDSEETLRNKYELLDETIRVTVPGKKIAMALEQYEKLAKGNIAPNFTVKKPNGDSFTLHDVQCKLKLLHFWRSDNPDCRHLNSELVKYYQDYRSRGLEIVSISLDENAAEWKRAIGSDGMIWVNGTELKGWESVLLYMFDRVPYFILMDAENRIVAKGLNITELGKNIAELLKKRK